jgi:hypothetical protein
MAGTGGSPYRRTQCSPSTLPGTSSIAGARSASFLPIVYRRGPQYLNADLGRGPSSPFFNADPDPNFQFNANPDPALHQSDANLRPQSTDPLGSVADWIGDPGWIKVRIRICNTASRAPFLSSTPTL